jgi:hypothetical protein
MKMAVLRVKGRACSVAVLALLALLAGAAGLLWTLPAASADPGFPAALVSNTFPGLVVAPPGAGNGPLTGGDLDLLGVNPSSASTVQGDLDGGVFSGYFRTWSRRPDNGDLVALGAFQSPLAADAFLAGANHAVRTQSGVIMDGAQGIPHAAVYTFGSLAVASTQLVFFDEGKDAFMLSVRSPSGDLSLADAVTLANRQAERVAGPAAGLSGGGWTSSSSLGYRIGEIFGGLASAALLCWLLSYWMTPRWRERAAVRRAAAVHAANGGDGAYPPPPRGAPDAGWLPNPLHANEQLFWNGREWAGRRRWMHGTGWVVRAPAQAR